MQVNRRFVSLSVVQIVLSLAILTPSMALSDQNESFPMSLDDFNAKVGNQSKVWVRLTEFKKLTDQGFKKQSTIENKTQSGCIEDQIAEINKLPDLLNRQMEEGSLKQMPGCGVLEIHLSDITGTIDSGYSSSTFDVDSTYMGDTEIHNCSLEVELEGANCNIIPAATLVKGIKPILPTKSAQPGPDGSSQKKSADAGRF